MYEFEGGLSGGTISSILSTFDFVPLRLLQSSSEPYALSPIVGTKPKNDGISLLHRLPLPHGVQFTGSFFPMAMTNIAVVQRTFGLLEMYSTQRRFSFLAFYVTTALRFFFFQFQNQRKTTKKVTFTMGLTLITKSSLWLETHLLPFFIPLV